jgi:hypothetical protein
MSYPQLPSLVPNLPACTSVKFQTSYSLNGTSELNTQVRFHHTPTIYDSAAATHPTRALLDSLTCSYDTAGRGEWTTELNVPQYILQDHIKKIFVLNPNYLTSQMNCWMLTWLNSEMHALYCWTHSQQPHPIRSSLPQWAWNLPQYPDTTVFCVKKNLHFTVELNITKPMWCYELVQQQLIGHLFLQQTCYHGISHRNIWSVVNITPSRRSHEDASLQHNGTPPHSALTVWNILNGIFHGDWPWLTNIWCTIILAMTKSWSCNTTQLSVGHYQQTSGCTLLSQQWEVAHSYGTNRKMWHIRLC